MTVGPEFLKADSVSVLGAEGEFSEAVTVAWKGTDYALTAIFDDTFQEYDADGNPVLSEYSRVTFEQNFLEDIVGEVPTTTEEEDTFTITARGFVFNAYDPEKDGSGLILYSLKLNKA